MPSLMGVRKSFMLPKSKLSTEFETVNVDGSTDYLTKSGILTGIVDGDAGTFVLRVKFDAASDGVAQQLFRIMSSTNGRLTIAKGGTNIVFVSAADSAPVVVYRQDASVALTGSSGWVTIFCSWDLSASATNLYVDDTDRAATVTTLNTSGVIDYNPAATQNVEAFQNGLATRGAFLDGSVQFLWFDNVYYDVSQQSVRDNWASPASLQSDGSGPGAQPKVYLTGAASAWAAGTNLGSGGNFTGNGDFL